MMQVMHTDEAGVVNLMLSNGYKIQETFSVFKEQVHQDLFFVKA
jgi:hypothetical protein